MTRDVGSLLIAFSTASVGATSSSTGSRPLKSICCKVPLGSNAPACCLSPFFRCDLCFALFASSRRSSCSAVESTALREVDVLDVLLVLLAGCPEVVPAAFFAGGMTESGLRLVLQSQACYRRACRARRFWPHGYSTATARLQHGYSTSCLVRRRHVPGKQPTPDFG